MSERDWVKCPKCGSRDAVGVSVSYKRETKFTCHDCGEQTSHDDYTLSWTKHDVMVYNNDADPMKNHVYPWEREE